MGPAETRDIVHPTEIIPYETNLPIHFHRARRDHRPGPGSIIRTFWLVTDLYTASRYVHCCFNCVDRDLWLEKRN